jgi:hypothetical protein
MTHRVPFNRYEHAIQETCRRHNVAWYGGILAKSTPRFENAARERADAVRARTVRANADSPC